MLQQHFLEAVSYYQQDAAHANKLWAELSDRYGSIGRKYHTLVHLEHVLRELLPYQASFSNWYTIVFALAYHDAIYNSANNNNEEKSARLAEKRLAEINFPEPERIRCVNFILATKKHESADEETHLFTDADLSILGAEPEAYKVYAQQIRQEYSLYPDFLYKPGRKKVLLHFLAMDKIYKTRSFQDRYEVQARINLETELHSANQK